MWLIRQMTNKETGGLTTAWLMNPLTAQLSHSTRTPATQLSRAKGRQLLCLAPNQVSETASKHRPVKAKGQQPNIDQTATL